MSEIIPALLPKNPEDLISSLSKLPKETQFIHLDILEVDIWTPMEKKFEVHLMFSQPENIVERWAERGAKSIIVHKLNENTRKFRGVGKIGLGVELHIPLEEIFPQVSEIDFLHLMSIAEIGGQGHPLDERIFDRIKRVREKFPQLIISVDGGVNETNFEKLKNLGIDRFVAGSGFNNLWKSLTKN